LLLDSGDDRLAVGANESSQNEFRMNRMSPDDLTCDPDQGPDPIRRQVSDVELSINLVKGDVVLLKVKINAILITYFSSK
jgi:hypothetical protein